MSAVENYVLLGKAVLARNEIENRIDSILRRAFPPETEIKFCLHGIIKNGKVVRNIGGDRLEILNSETGKKRTIFAHQLVQAKGFV